MGEIGGDSAKVLAFGHLDIKQEKKIEEIRRILPNLGKFDQKRVFVQVVPERYAARGGLGLGGP